MKCKLVKPFRYGTRVFEKGEVATIVEVDHPVTFNGKPIYDYYAQFDNHEPIGVLKDEIEIIGEH